MKFPSFKRRSRLHSRSASTTYASLELRQMLAFAPFPELTSDVSVYAQTVDHAIVRVDDQQRLIIRPTGQDNRIDIYLQFNYLQVNRDNYNTLALEIDPTQYSKIILIGDGQDTVRVSGDDLSAQMHPGRLWVSAYLASEPGGKTANLQIHGSNLEHLEVNDDHYQDVGPFIHLSENRVRMYGSNGADQLEMSSEDSFAIATRVALRGDGYYFSSNVFGDLFVDGGGGEDSANMAGTRGFESDAFILSESTTGNDVYRGRDNHSRISNELWDGRFVNFETQRIDLLSGDDRGYVSDQLREDAYYLVDGDELIGAFRRMAGIERIKIDGTVTAMDTFVRPDAEQGQFNVTENDYEFRSFNDIATDSHEGVPPSLTIYSEVFPDYFVWKFISFERLT